MGKTVLVNKTGKWNCADYFKSSGSCQCIISTNVRELQEAILTCKFDRSVRCIVITGAGEKAFCAGADLKERAGMDLIQVGRRFL